MNAGTMDASANHRTSLLTNSLAKPYVNSLLFQQKQQGTQSVKRRHVKTRFIDVWSHSKLAIAHIDIRLIITTTSVPDVNRLPLVVVMEMEIGDYIFVV